MYLSRVRMHFSPAQEAICLFENPRIHRNIFFQEKGHVCMKNDKFTKGKMPIHARDIGPFQPSKEGKHNSQKKKKKKLKT